MTIAEESDHNNMEINQVETPNQKGIWSPLAVGLFCFFFSFLAAGIMNAISYGRIGESSKKQKRLLLVIGAFIVFMIIAVVTPDGTRPLFTAFHIGTILYFRHDQQKIYDKHVAAGGKKAGIGLPLGIALACSLVFIILLFMGL